MGRFAPSPTGLLHMGSLMAAVASFLEAQRSNGLWLLRIEDLDPPREVAGASASFLSILSRFGFVWDGDVLYQSRRSERYAEVLAELLKNGQVYRCQCTRKVLLADGLRGIDGFRYVGRCRDSFLPDNGQVAYRLKVPDMEIDFLDGIQGFVRQNLQQELGDFVLRRADGFWAYQLAVVIDDADSGVTHIVRGADLLDSTPRQRYLQSVLAFSHPEYMHIPVISNAQGEKFSKQTLAPTLREGDEVQQLWDALYLLWQNPPAELRRADLAELWAWAKTHWHSGLIPPKRSVAVTLGQNFEYKFL
ncbi:tRNA glutamyl-Q(34) synthetase GluQRS [Chitinibacter sp. SCUT-21]